MKHSSCLLGIIGDPIGHSLSPAMQNAALSRLKIGASYRAFAVAPRDLAAFLKKDVAGLNLKGLNVTIPHKEAVLKYCKKISPEARAIGAINTLVVSPKGLVGYNTDAAGYLRSLTEDTGFRPSGKTVLVLGAGGAARAVLYALARAGADPIFISNRTPARARSLARYFRKIFPKTFFQAVSQDKASFTTLFSGVDLVVNTTSVGMKGKGGFRLPLALLPKTAVVSDLVYRPLMTTLLKAARRRKLRIHTGLGMLLHQGALSFKLWTGKMPDRRVMHRALLDALRKKA